MKLQLAQDAPSFLWLECLVERSRSVGVEVIQNHPYLFCLRIVIAGQLPHLLGEIYRCAPFPEIDVAPRSLRLEEHEEVAHPSALVLVVVAFGTPWPGGDGHTLLGHHLVRHLVKAHSWPLRVVGLLVELQNVLHAPHKLRAHLWDAPLLFHPRLNVPFLSVRRTVSSEISSTTSSSTSLSASICILQRFLPSGGSEQAKAIRYAS